MRKPGNGERARARRACVAALAALAALAPLSCKRPSEGGSGLPRPANLESSVAMGDPRAGAQLLRGFYGIEAGAWRWTARQFSAMLRTPAGAAQNGAVLEFRLTVPDPVIAKLKSVTLDASIGGAIFPPATYDKPGDYAYTAAVPAEQLAGEAVTVNFELDKAMPPNPPELRELGVVAHSVALRPRAAR